MIPEDAYTTSSAVKLSLFQARFLESRRSANEAREHTSVCDRAERVLQRRVEEAGAERALGYMTK